MRRNMSERSLTRSIKNLISRHGKVRLTFADESDIDNHIKVCSRCFSQILMTLDLRRRVINKRGRCRVAYKGYNYKKFSGYDESCFMEAYYRYDLDYDECEKRINVGETLELMFDHDRGSDLKLVLIEYGKGFKKRIKL